MIICVLGPTAVGKTKLSEVLAKKYNGIVINADSTQIYKELNIGTAKITKSEMEVEEHYLFDIKSPFEDYSVYEYQRDVRKLFKENKDRNIIIVGGTGLYVKAALYNYEFKEFTSKNSYDGYSNQELYDLLKAKNLEKTVHINNRRRMISILNSGGNNHKKDELLYNNVLLIGLTTDRKNLYNRIDNRVDEMMELGLLEEVQSLYKKYGNVKSLMTAIGYKELIDYINGNCSLDVSIDLIKKRSRHYAKRQYTWFNNQMNIKWFQTNYEYFSKTIKEVEEYIDCEKERHFNN